MLLDHDFQARWEQIINEIDIKNHVPVNCVKKVVFKTLDRRQKTINLRNLRSQGVDNDSIEQAVSNYISDNEHNILSMELVLDVEAVADIVQPETDRLLRGI